MFVTRIKFELFTYPKNSTQLTERTLNILTFFLRNPSYREIKKRRGQSKKKTKNVKCKILFYEQVTNRAKFDLAACPRPLISGSDLSA